MHHALGRHRRADAASVEGAWRLWRGAGPDRHRRAGQGAGPAWNLERHRSSGRIAAPPRGWDVDIPRATERSTPTIQSSCGVGNAVVALVLLRDSSNIPHDVSQVPALADASGRFVLNDAGDGVDTKPHGHGDVHALLCAAGLPETWLAQGFEHVFFFQDTNAFALRSFAANLGVAVASNADAHSGCVARKPGEAMGALCRLEKADGTAVVRNVESFRRADISRTGRRDADGSAETSRYDVDDSTNRVIRYNQLAPLLQETTGAGDVADATGSSPYPGNTNQLLLKLGGPHGYVATLRRSNGAVPEFVNPKYADETRTTFKKPTRLECMMQDYPLLLTPGARVGFCVLKRDALREYSPVKNATADGAAKVSRGPSGRRARFLRYVLRPGHRQQSNAATFVEDALFEIARSRPAGQAGSGRRVRGDGRVRHVCVKLRSPQGRRRRRRRAREADVRGRPRETPSADVAFTTRAALRRPSSSDDLSRGVAATRLRGIDRRLRAAAAASPRPASAESIDASARQPRRRRDPPPRNIDARRWPSGRASCSRRRSR